MTADKHHIRMGFGYTGRNRTNTNRRNQFDVDTCTGIGILQIMDKLCQILNRIDIVMGRGRNKADTRR